MSDIQSTSSSIFHLQEERRLCEDRIEEIKRKIAKAKEGKRQAREKREAEFNQETKTNWLVIIICLLFCFVGIIGYFIYDYFHTKEVKLDLEAKSAEDQRYWDGIISGYKKQLKKEKLYLEQLEEEIQKRVFEGEGT